MKGGAAYNQSYTTGANTDATTDRGPQNNGRPNNVLVEQLPEETRLGRLGFDEAEIELFSDNSISDQDVVDQYLAIARAAPYNINWNSEEDARRDLQQVKRDIAKDSFAEISRNFTQGGKNRKSRKSRKGKSRKTKKSKKSRKSRKSRKTKKSKKSKKSRKSRKSRR